MIYCTYIVHIYRQVGHLGRRKDDNYIALREIDTGEYLINGGFVVSMFSKTVQGSRGILA
jgi:hypothetical protein